MSEPWSARTHAASPPQPGGPRRAALIILIGSLCIAALIAIIAIASDGEINETGAKALGTAAALSVYSLAGLACGALGRKRPEAALLGNAGVVVAGLGLLITVVEIWAGVDSEDDDSAYQAIGCSLVISLGVAHICLLLRRSPREDRPAVAFVRVATVALTLLLAGLLVAAIASDSEVADGRTLGIIAVLWVLGTILTPLLRLLESAGQRR
jgi:hypothetical protein